MEEKAKAETTLAALQDILESEAEWSGLPSVVRLAFRASHALARHSFELLAATQAEIAAKVDKDDLKKAFRFKANIVDVEDSLEKVSEALETKVSIEDLEAVLENYVRADTGKSSGEDRETLEDLEARVKKLEDVTLTLASDEQQNYAKNFITRAEFLALENDVANAAKFEEIDELKSNVLTREDLDKVIKNELLPDLAEQVAEIQKETKERLDGVIEELESRVNLDEFSVIRHDIERLLAEQRGPAGKPQVSATVDEIRKEQESLHQRLADLESLPDFVTVMKSDLKNITSVNRNIQASLSRISEDIMGLPVTSRINEIDHQLNAALKGVDARVERLEAANRRTQEVLEILSKSKLKSVERLDDEQGDDSHRAKSFPRGAPGMTIDQVSEIKSYVDKKLRKIEAVYATRDDFEQLEAKVEETDSAYNKIFETLKDMLSDLNSKVKKNFILLDEKIQTVDAKLEKEGRPQKTLAKASVLAQLDETSKGEINNRSGNAADKLKNLDELILKVSGLVSKKAADDGWKNEFLQRVATVEKEVEKKADKVNTGKLLDRKAGSGQ